MAIANGGVVYRPQIVRAWFDPETGRTLQAKPEVLRRIPIKQAHLDLVRQAMVEVTLPGGTAAGAGANAPYLFAGKTGTAQVKSIRQSERYDARRVAAWHRDHALFVAFAPADAPRIVVAVMVENGGHGGSTAAPMARKVIDYWLLGKLPGVPVPAPAAAEATASGAADDAADPEGLPEEVDHAD
jgi:penicillin-binding protein 2